MKYESTGFKQRTWIWCRLTFSDASIWTVYHECHVRGEASESKEIGPSGGKIELLNGEERMQYPDDPRITVPVTLLATRRVAPFYKPVFVRILMR